MNDRDPFIRRALLLLATIVLVGSLIRLLIFALQGDEHG